MFYGRESISLGVARQVRRWRVSPAGLFRATEAPMQHSRRRLLLISSAALGGILVPFAKISAQEPVGSGRKRPTDGSQDAANGEGPNAANLPASAAKTMLEERQKNIKKDVRKLYELASDLKNEVEKTDSTAVLSIAMLKKADEIEKLARQIKDRAKG